VNKKKRWIPVNRHQHGGKRKETQAEKGQVFPLKKTVRRREGATADEGITKFGKKTVAGRSW